VYGTAGRFVFIFADNNNSNEIYALKAFCRKEPRNEIDKVFGARISQENSPFVIKYFCKLKVDLTEDILNHFSFYYNLNEIDFSGMLKTPLVDKTFDTPKHLSPRSFPRPPYDGTLMEYADGITLGKLRYTNMTEERLIRILYGVISSIQTLHSIGIVHNDIKGNNYVVLPNDMVKLCMILLFTIFFFF
jgi:serine/threonine protein kinase